MQVMVMVRQKKERHFLLAIFQRIPSGSECVIAG